MTGRVSADTQVPSVPEAPLAAARTRVSGGVGGIPDTLQRQVTPEKGWIETAVIWLKDQIVLLLFKLFFYFSEHASSDPVPSAAETQQPGTRHAEVLKKLETVIGAEEIQAYFRTYFPTEKEKNDIYLWLGAAVPLSPLRSLLYTYYSEAGWYSYTIETGRRMVEKDPTLVLFPLTSKIKQIIKHTP